MSAEETVRLRNINSGAVMSTAVETAVRLGSEWVPFDDSSTSDDEGKGYGDLKAAELKAEIEKRNADREDDAKLAITGNKAALVAALEADDAAIEETTEDDADSEDPNGSDEDADSED